ncbi:MAG: efflux RND transporter periplasmic adaptor subunit [Bacteroidales bacterium]
MKNIKIAIVALAFGMAITSCNMQPPAEAAAAGTTTTEKKARPVRSMVIDYKNTAIEQNLTATVEAFKETYLSPALQGRIRSVKVEVNDHVKQGQLLVEMDRTQLDQTQLQYETLKTEMARMDTLLQYGSVTQQAYDQTKSQLETTELVLENLEENTLMRAPHSGIITGKYYNDGELFSPTPNTQAGKAALVSMVQIDPVKVIVNLSETFLPMVKEGLEATIETDVYPEEVFSGTVFRIHPTINPGTRTFTVEVKVPNKGEKLLPGMFARVSLRLGEKEALIVPAITVMQTPGTNERYVMLYDGGVARKVTVRIVNRYDDQLEIASTGIHGGEELIYAGQSSLEDGDPVRVVVE